MLWLIKGALSALYPPTDRFPGVGDLELDAYLRKYRRETTVLMWAGVVIGAVVFTVSPVVTLGIPLPSFLLPKGALDRHAHALTTHNCYWLRQPTFLLKVVGGMCWGQNPRVRERFGLAPYADDPGTWKRT